MSFFVKKLFEPLTEASGSQGAAEVILSDSLRKIVRELTRYTQGEILGRSYLIAGHRGVGKTTMVRKAVEMVQTNLSSFGIRPLYVELHGPDLLAPERKPDRPAGMPPETENKTEVAPDDPIPYLQPFVERLTLGLYLAASKEFGERFQKVIGIREPELAGQFQWELVDRGADLARLRSFYDRAGALNRGVLFQTLPPGLRSADMEGTRGVRELTALAGAAQAFRIVSGNVKVEEKRDDTASAKSSIGVTAENLMPALTGLLAGGLAWTGLGDQTPITRAFSALLTGTAATIVVKLTSSRERETKEGVSSNFIPKQDANALRRLLPQLVDSFRSVGLAPVFVVDELDKVEGIETRMETLMGYLKQFVSERAFFLFLTDRSYFELVEMRIAERERRIESTMFGERILLQYQIKDLHEYLDRIIEEIPGVNPTPDVVESRRKHRALLPYLLLFRSCMHPNELRRGIHRYTDQMGTFEFEVGALFNDFLYRNEILIQAAIERALASEELKELLRGSACAQLAYDAAYFPARRWDPNLEFDASETEFRQYMIQRMGLEDATDGPAKPAASEQILSYTGQYMLYRMALESGGENQKKSLSHEQLLFRTMRKVISYLENPGQLAKDLAADPSEKVKVLGQLVEHGKPLLVPVEGKASRYKWTFDTLGRNLMPAEEKKEPSAAARLAEEPRSPLDMLMSLLRWTEKHPGSEIDFSLWEKLGILPSPPEWSRIEIFLTNPEAGADGSPIAEEEKTRRKQETETFWTNLRSSQQGIEMALGCACVMGMVVKESPNARRRALEVLGQSLVRGRSREEKVVLLLAIWEQLRKQFQIGEPFAEAGNQLQDGRVENWLSALQTAESVLEEQLKSKRSDLERYPESAWDYWLQWFEKDLKGESIVAQPNLWNLLSRAADETPGNLFRDDPREMTITNWTNVLRAPAPNAHASWLRILALVKLGFYEAARREREGDLLISTSRNLSELLARLVQSQENERKKISIVVEAGGPSETWRPWPGVACVRVPKHDLFLNGQLTLLLGTSVFDYALIETSNDLEELKEEVIESAPDELRNFPARRICYMGKQTLPREIIANPYYLENPKSLEEAVRKLESLPETIWSAKN